jgi:hypothetical protein
MIPGDKFEVIEDGEVAITDGWGMTGTSIICFPPENASA